MKRCVCATQEDGARPYCHAHVVQHVTSFYISAQFLLIKLLYGLEVQYVSTGTTGTAHTWGVFTEKEHVFFFLFHHWKSRNSILPSSWPAGVLTFSDCQCCFSQILSLYFLFFSPCSRISPMTNLKWNSMLTLLMVWWWRATCSRGPAMPLRPGTGMLHRHDWIYWMLVMLWNTWEFICFYCHHFFSSVLVRPLKLRHHLRHCVKLPFLSSFSSVMENNLSQNVTFVKFKLFQHWQVFWTIFCQRQFLSFTQIHLFYTQH